MNPSRHQRNTSAFTRAELAVTLVGVLMLAAVLLQVRAVRMREVQLRQACINNLKQVGLAYRVWASDFDGRFPQHRSVTNRGTREHVLGGELSRHYQAMSNQLGTPAVLVCPSDSRRAAVSFAGSWSNTSVGYFVGMDAEGARPEMFLTGDRNITNGLAPAGGLLTLATANPPGWDRPWHQGHGILGLGDGSVHQMTTAQLQSHIAKNAETNRIALPLP